MKISKNVLKKSILFSFNFEALFTIVAYYEQFRIFRSFELRVLDEHFQVTL